MEHIEAFFRNYWIASAFGGWFVAQILKVFTGFFRTQQFSIRKLLFASGGMPSSHTAASAALCTACAMTYGLGSMAFAMSGVLTMIVMIDATGVRRETGKQSRALNQIIEELFSDSIENFETHFKELIGHSPLQVFFGCVTGILTAVAVYWLPWISHAI